MVREQGMVLDRYGYVSPFPQHLSNDDIKMTAVIDFLAFFRTRRHSESSVSLKLNFHKMKVFLQPRLTVAHPRPLSFLSSSSFFKDKVFPKKTDSFRMRNTLPFAVLGQLIPPDALGA